MTKEIDDILERLENASERLKAVAQGRVYNVGTKVLFRGKFGVVTDLNQGSEDPAGSTVDIRMEDGTTHDSVSVTSTSLELFRQ